MMNINESLVAPDRFEAECGESNHRTDYLAELGVDSVNSWLSNYPASYEALPPHGASSTIGRAMSDISTERLAHIFKVIKNDEDCVRSAQMLPEM